MTNDQLRITPSTVDYKRLMNIENHNALYLYCFTRLTELPEMIFLSVDTLHPIFLLRFRNISAVVSNVSIHEFSGEEAEASMQDLSLLAPRVWRHEKTIEIILSQSPVFPAQFGSLFSSYEQLAALIESNYNIIDHFLEEMQDKEEWGIKVFLERKKAEDTILFQLHSQQEKNLSTLSEGFRYFKEKEIKAAADKKLKQLKDEVKQTIVTELHPAVLECRGRKCIATEKNDQEKELAANLAFLLCKKNLHSFKDKTDSLNFKYKNIGCTLEITGPWPPYTFCPGIS